MTHPAENNTDTVVASHACPNAQVDNMFMPNAWGAYCSEIAPNINALGFLRVRQAYTVF